jgi:hypothetical protein
MNKTNNIHSAALLCVALSLSLPLSSADEPLESAVKTQLKAQKRSIESQEQVNTLADETRDMLQEYRTAIRSIDSLKVYNRQLEKLTGKQQEELSSIERQLGHIEQTQRDIVPLMLRMVDVLEEFISLDMPFLKEERANRMAAIREMMDRPDVTLPDKFRRIMEAYQIEMEYGRTIEAYNETITVNGEDHTVDVLRVGRISLNYLTLDQGSAGFWNTETQAWEPLPDNYLQSIQQGLKIARKQTSPDLFKLPVRAPEAAR